MQEHWEISARWYGPIELRRVENGEFTASMLDVHLGAYLWGHGDEDDFHALYVGQGRDPLKRQADHLRGRIGGNLTQIRREGHSPLLWIAHIGCAEFCATETDVAIEKQALELSELALIHETRPAWNRANVGDAKFARAVRLMNLGRRPPGLRRVVRRAAKSYVWSSR